MTYSLNGIPFDNPDFGWRFRSTSKPLADLSAELSSVPRQGRHGLLSPAPGVLGAPTLLMVVQTPRAHLQTLEALVRQGGVLTSTYGPGSAVVEFVSASPTGYGPAESIVDLAVVFRVPAGVARGAEVTSDAVALASASVPVGGLLPGLAVDVQDAILRVKGAVTGLQVTDSGGSWFTYGGAIGATQWLRFEADTGRAFMTDTDVWTGGAEVSGAVDFGGPRGLFEITPAWTTDPAVREGRLTVATGTRTGASIQVRGRPAYFL